MAQSASPNTRSGSRPTATGKGRVSGKGISRGSVRARSNRLKMKDTIKGITKGDIRRLARRGGIKRISAAIYDDVRSCLIDHLRPILKDCATYVEHANRRTVTVVDVIFALKRRGRPIYGFDPETTRLQKKPAGKRRQG